MTRFTQSITRIALPHIHLPPLRDLREDSPLLATALLTKCCQELGQEPKKFAPAALRVLTAYA